MPTQPRKLFWNHWQKTYGVLRRRRPLIIFDWAAPAVWMTTGAWGMNEELTWGAPKVDIDPGAFSVSESIDYAGPTMGMSAGGFVVEVQLSTSGPTMAMDAGSFTIVDELVWSAPKVDMDPGAFSVGEALDMSGPVVGMDPGAFSVENSQSYAGPTIGMDAGAWSFEVAYPVAGPTMAINAGAASFEEQLSYGGPAMGMDAGSFSHEREYPYAAGTVAMDPGGFTQLEQLEYAGPTMAMDPGAFTTGVPATEYSWSGPSVEMEAGEFTRVIESFLTDGTQYIDGALSFTGPTTIVLDPTVYAVGGNYILFDYGSFPGGQTELDAQVTIDDTGLPLAELVSLDDEPANSRIVLELRSRPTNGKQFVDGNLDFAGATTIYLSEELYATPGTYELFEVTGTVSNLGNLTVVSEAGFSVVPGSIALVGGIISVTLA